MRRFWLLILLVLAPAAEARPYRLDDMLRLESYGQVVMSPDERWGIVERRDAYETAARFDYDSAIERALSKLYRVDLVRGERLERAFTQDPKAGYWSGGFSPSGRRLAVFRLLDNALTVGVLDIEARTVRWLAGAVDLPVGRPSPIWLDEDNLLFVSRTNNVLPMPLSDGNLRPRIITGLRQSSEGTTPTATIYGSGRFRNAGLATDGKTLMRIDLRTGVTRVLGAGLMTDLLLSPDGRQLAVTTLGEAISPDPDVPVSFTFQPRRQMLSVIDVASGKATFPCAKCDILPNMLSWSTDGSLLFYARAPAQTWDEGHLYRLTSGGETVAALPETLRMEVRTGSSVNLTVNAAWAGNDIIARARRAADGHSGWWRISRGRIDYLGGTGFKPLFQSGRFLWGAEDARLIGIDDRGKVHRTSETIVSTGTVNLDIISLGSRQYFNPELETEPLLLIRREGGIAAASIDRATGRPKWTVPLPSPDALPLASADGSGTLIHFSRGPDGVGRLILSRAGGETRLLDSIDTHLAGVELPKRRPVQTIGPEGQRLTHWLTMPPGTERAPLAVTAYPGLVRPDGDPPAHNPSAFNPDPTNPLLLVAAGFAVLEASIPTTPAARETAVGETSTGQITIETAVTDATVDPIDRYTRIVLAALDAAAKEHVDPTRTALIGHSFGGYAVLGIASRTQRFDAIVGSAGPYDLTAGYGGLPAYADIAESGMRLDAPFAWSESGQAGLGVPLWRAPDLYRERSPLYAVERIATPVMLIHGDFDIVPVFQAERMFMALYRLSRDAVWLRYAGEGHSAASPANIRDLWQRLPEFMRGTFDRPLPKDANGAPTPPDSPDSSAN